MYRAKEQRKRKELIIQGEPHWNRVSCLDHQLERQKFHAVTQKVKIFQVLGMPNGPVGSQNRDLSGEIAIPSADETLTQKRTYSESTALPNYPGAWSGSGETCTRRQYRE